MTLALGCLSTKSLIDGQLLALRNFSPFVINIADKRPNFRECPTLNIVKSSCNFVDSSISYLPPSRRI